MKIILLCLILLIFSITFLFYDFNNSTYIINNPSQSKEQEIEINNFYPSDNETIIINGVDWDINLYVEIGNILEVNGVKYLNYVGYSGEYSREAGQPNVYCGVATNNGSGWLKHGKALNYRCEDPYVIYRNGVFYMWFEDKEYYPDTNSSLAISTDGINYELTTLAALRVPSSPPIWLNSDASSIIVYDTGSYIYTLFESRGDMGGGQFNQGSVGEGNLTYNSITGIFNLNVDEQIIQGSYFGEGQSLNHWRAFVATDDLVYIDNTYYLTLHTLSHSEGWTTGLWKSSNLNNWTLVVDEPVFNYSTVMFDKDSYNNCLRFYTVQNNNVKYINGSHLIAYDVPVCETYYPQL